MKATDVTMLPLRMFVVVITNEKEEQAFVALGVDSIAAEAQVLRRRAGWKVVRSEEKIEGGAWRIGSREEMEWSVMLALVMYVLGRRELEIPETQVRSFASMGADVSVEVLDDYLTLKLTMGEETPHG